MATLEAWAWPEQGVNAEQRRQLNGKYRIFQDEDLFDSLLLHYIGVRWSIHFQNALKSFAKDNIWIKPRSISEQVKERRIYYLGERALRTNMEKEQMNIFEKRFFLTQLQRDEREVGASYADEDNEIDESIKIRESLSESKQTVLHLLSTEILIKTRLYGELAVLRSDFKSFGPSLAHSTIFAVLEFFGVSEVWRNFFRRALETPLKFAEDGPNAKLQVRRRGTPMSSPLADFFTEVLLFCMDFDVHQATNGSHLFRLHDDFWLWGPELTCSTAWKTLTEFAKLMGLEFNREKTGSQEIFPSGKRPSRTLIDTTLPSGDIRWGFLVLNSKGRFVIDDAMVDNYTKELRQQLSKCQSTLAWVQVYNSFLVKHLTSMFGKPANAFGRQHTTMALEMFHRIHDSLFKNEDPHLNLEGGSVEGHVKAKLARHGLKLIPNGFLYFPIDLGGLDLRNPFIPLNQVLEEVRDDSEYLMDWFYAEEKKKYLKAKATFEEGLVKRRRDLKYIPPNPQEFFPFEEYIEHAEQTSEVLHTVFMTLMRQPSIKSISMSQRLAACVELSDWEWEDLTPYHQWAVQTYAQEIITTFGGLQIVEKDLLPLGIIKAFRSRRAKWQV